MTEKNEPSRPRRPQPGHRLLGFRHHASRFPATGHVLDNGFIFQAEFDLAFAMIGSFLV